MRVGGRRGDAGLIPSAADPGPIRIAVSSCLLGEPVRYDGGHKREEWVARVLARRADLVPICPEAGAGLGVPRPPIRLVGDPRRPRAVGVEDPACDVTPALNAFARAAARALGEVDGYILKAGSPSCGPGAVPVFGPRGGRRPGVGLHALAIRRLWPLLPFTDETALRNAAGREHFFERVRAHRRWRRLLAGRVTLAALADFHAQHELTLTAHAPAARRRLARLLAEGGPARAVARRYGAVFMAALARPATRSGHARALRLAVRRVAAGHGGDADARLSAAVEAFRRGRAPRAAALTQLRRHLRRHPDPWLAGQVYLEPVPAWVARDPVVPAAARRRGR